MTRQMEKDILEHYLQDDEELESSDEEASDDTDDTLEETENSVEETEDPVEEAMSNEPEGTSVVEILEVDETEIENMQKEIEDEVDNLKDLHGLNKQWKPFRDHREDTQSIRSMSTIAPEDV